MLSIRVDNSRVNKLAASSDQFRKELAYLQREMLKQEASLAARLFAAFTPPQPTEGTVKAESSIPQGFQRGALLTGLKAMELDIRSVVMPDTATLEGVMTRKSGNRAGFEAWKAKPIIQNSSQIIADIHRSSNVDKSYQKARNLYDKKKYKDRHVGPEQMRSIHEGQRKLYKGRIRRHRGPDPSIKKYPYFAKSADIKRYIREKKKQVGYMKSGWVSVIYKIGTVRLRGQYIQPGLKNIPKWIVGKATDGRWQLNFNPITAIFGRGNTAVITNPRGNAYNIANEEGLAWSVLRARQAAIDMRPYRSHLNYIIRDFKSRG